MFLLPLPTLLRKYIEFRAFLTSENSLKLCSAGQALGSLLCVYIYKCAVLKGFPGSTWKPSEFGCSAFERRPAVQSISDSFRARKPAPPLLRFVPSPLALFPSASSLFPLWCALQSASQIRLFIPSLPPGISPPEHHFHLPQRLWWLVTPATHVLTSSCMCTVIHVQEYLLKKGLWVY